MLWQCYTKNCPCFIKFFPSSVLYVTRVWCWAAVPGLGCSSLQFCYNTFFCVLLQSNSRYQKIFCCSSCKQQTQQQIVFIAVYSCYHQDQWSARQWHHSVSQCQFPCQTSLWTQDSIGRVAVGNHLAIGVCRGNHWQSLKLIQEEHWATTPDTETATAIWK